MFKCLTQILLVLFAFVLRSNAQVVQLNCVTLDFVGPCSVMCGNGTQKVYKVPFGAECEPSVIDFPCSGVGCFNGEYCILGECVPNYVWFNPRNISTKNVTTIQPSSTSLHKSENPNTWGFVWIDTNSKLWVIFSQNEMNSWTDPVHLLGIIPLENPSIVFHNGYWVISATCNKFGAVDIYSISINRNSTSEISNVSQFSVISFSKASLINTTNSLLTRMVLHEKGVVLAVFHSKNLTLYHSEDGINWTKTNTVLHISADYVIGHFALISDGNRLLFSFSDEVLGTYVYSLSQIWDGKWDLYLNLTESRILDSAETFPHLVNDGNFSYMFVDIWAHAQKFIGFRNISDNSSALSTYVPTSIIATGASSKPIAAFGNGILLVVFEGQQQIFKSTINVPDFLPTLMYSFSRDSGRTWTSPRAITETFVDVDLELLQNTNDMAKIMKFFAKSSETLPQLAFMNSTGNFMLTWWDLNNKSPRAFSKSIFIDPCDGVYCIPHNGIGTHYILPIHKLPIPSNFTGDLIIIGHHIFFITIDGSITISNGTITIGGVAATGNLTVIDRSVIIITANVSTVNISGCIKLQSVVLNISEDLLKTSTFYINSSSDCVEFTDVTSYDGRCAKVEKAGYGSGLFVIYLLPCDRPNSASETSDITIIAVVTILVLIIAIGFAIFAVKYKPARNFLFPFRDRQRKTEKIST